MSNEVLLAVENVSKKFCKDLRKSLWYGLTDVVREISGQGYSHGALRSGEFWSVNDVSFQLKRGECLGLIGPNGAGKSTLLKLLNGLMKPDKGQITMRGRVGALIELGAGFNPVLTGRENIYVNGAVLGFTKNQIDQKFGEIVEFAEVEKFLDTPVQNYSSGMKVRLGFAIAVQMEPDIMLIDEVLAVGDLGFRSKCYAKIADLMRRSAVIFVSHQMSQVARLCEETIVINEGKVVFMGETSKSIATYNDLFTLESQKAVGTMEASLSNLSIINTSVVGSMQVRHGDSIRILFELIVSDAYDYFNVDVGISAQDGTFLAQCHSKHNGALFANTGEKMFFSLDIGSISLNPGNYNLSIIVSDSKNAKQLLWVPVAMPIKIEGDFYGGAPIQITGDWKVS